MPYMYVHTHTHRHIQYGTIFTTRTHLLSIDGPSERQILHVAKVTVALEEVDVNLSNRTVVLEDESHNRTVREEHITGSEHSLDTFLLRPHVEPGVS